MATDNKRCFRLKDTVTVTDEVIAIIAGLAATEVEGVDSLAGYIKHRAVEKAGLNRLSRGVKIIQKDRNELVIRLAINIEYGKNITEICEAIQEKVTTTIKNMTGMVVASVDIKIASVILENVE